MLSALAAWWLTHFVFKVPLVVASLPAAGIAALMIGVVVTIGIIATRGFRLDPLAALRE